MRLGQRGNYTPCCTDGCKCDGFRKRPSVPKALDAIADVVLRYRPKPKSEPAKQRRKKRRKLEKEKTDGR